MSLSDFMAEVLAFGASVVWSAVTGDATSDRTADTYINGMYGVLAGQGLALEVTAAARNKIERLIETAVDVDAEISNTINTPLVEFIRREDLQSGDCIVLDADEHEFVFDKE